jgi:phosphonate transport system permease protein
MRKSVRSKAILFDALSFGYFFVVLDQVFLSWFYTSEFSWNRLSAIFFLGVLLGSLWFFTAHSVGAKFYGFAGQETAKIWTWLRILFLSGLGTGTFALGLLVTKFSLSDLFNIEGLKGAGRIFSAILHPEWSILGQTTLAMIETLYIAFIATVFAIPPAFILSFLAAKNIAGKNRIGHAVYLVLRTAINFFRSVEPLIWAIIFSVWVGIGPFAGMLALMVNSVPGLIKLYSEQIESVDDGLILAIRVSGAFPFQVIWFAVVPQIILPFLAFTIYRWDVNVRMATVIGLVGGGGIGTLLMQYQGLARWNEVGLIILMISSVVWIIDCSSAKIREMVR